MSVLMLIHSVQTSLYVFAASFTWTWSVQTADPKAVSTLPGGAEGGKGSTPAQHLAQRIWHPPCSGLDLGARGVAGSFLQCIPWCVGGHLSERGTCSCALGPLMQTKAKEVLGRIAAEHPPAPSGNTVGDPPPKVQGQFGYGMENLLAKAAVPALLSCLWPGSFASSLGVLSEWSPWLLPTSLTSGNREHLCAQGHCQVKSFGKGSGVHSLLCKMTAEG